MLFRYLKIILVIYNKADPELQKLYGGLDEEFIKARNLTGKTQAEVAKIMGTKTSAIGRLEISLITQKHSPTLATLQKYAHGYIDSTPITVCHHNGCDRIQGSTKGLIVFQCFGYDSVACKYFIRFR